MPAKSIAQQKLMGMALHNPKKIYRKNKGVLSMGKEDLQDFASTKQTGLPMHILPTGLKKIRLSRKR